MKDNSIVFVDSNIFIYAHDLNAGQKHKIAKLKLLELWDDLTRSSTSIQVLQEFFINLLKKGIPEKVAEDTIKDYFVWNIVDNNKSLLIDAFQERKKWNLSFWDALVLAAARSINATTIWSEDFNSRQNYNGVVVINPLK